jgi:hypothetical protein
MAIHNMLIFVNVNQFVIYFVAIFINFNFGINKSL